MVRDRASRILATVLFIDIVDSTRIASTVGDRRWRTLLGEFRRAVRRELRRHHGREQDTAGDGFFATFQSPASAVMAAAAIVGASQRLGFDVRCGLHAGELQSIDGRLGGIAAHIGARVASQATPAEVLVSATVHDLVTGGAIGFGPGRRSKLKGVPGTWVLHPVTAVEAVTLPAPLGHEVGALHLPPSASSTRLANPVGLASMLVMATALLLAGSRVLLPSAEGAAVETPLASPDPVTMVRIDPGRNAVDLEVRDRYLSVGRGSEVWTIDGSLWQGTAAHLVRRDPSTGEPLSTFNLPGNTGWTTFGFGSIWHIREEVRFHTLVRVDPVSGHTVATIPLNHPLRDVTFGRTAIWVLTSDGIVLELSPSLNQIVAEHATGIETVPDAMAAIGDELWICECDEGRLIEFDPASGSSSVHVVDPEAGFVLTDQRVSSQGTLSLDVETIWLIDGRGATVTPFDTESGEAGRSQGIPPDVWNHAFGLGSLWLAANDVVHRMELDSLRMISIRLPVGIVARGVAVDEETGSVWVSNCDCSP